MLEGLGARALAAGLRACGLPPWAELRTPIFPD